MLAMLPNVFQARGARLERGDPALEAVQSPCLLVEPPIQRFPITSNENGKAAGVSTKRLANLVDMAAEIGGRSVHLVTGASDQFRIHGPSLAAPPHLVNVATWSGQDCR